ncbi:MAG: YrdB family protein [Candidatus Nanopelagicales bacterium]
MTAVALGVRFLLELATLAALAVAGFTGPGSPVLKVVLGVGLPVLAALAWGRWVAPKATHRLPDPARLVVELVVLGSGVAALLLAGHVGWASALAVALVVDEAAVIALRAR